MFKAPTDYIAALALTVSIVAILAQLRAVRRQLFIQNFAEHNRRYNELLRRMPAVFLDPHFRLEDLDEAARETSVRAAWEYFDLCFEQWYLIDNRLVSRKLANVWESGTRASMSRPAFARLWSAVLTLTSYPPGFVRFMDQAAAVGDARGPEQVSFATDSEGP
ncbi:hypothetical protein SAMN05421812_11150 [Asanoa hainanensis]|uniref:DUF4760 domain-containing protein n=1 Tax=Asanoa hainanensis TaxID=560556 RepID=A0A239NX61_9ACTN|nr:hypothetical protein [Asanoa hainanensis]SNT58709.1 hypothetical protein SAMN05421812_11150 [Asanoa hainanensis]